jgi:DNA polymerase-1
VSTAWVQGKLNQAAKDGYITGAFGLRVRTPLLAQVVRGGRHTPREAEAEGRTAGNALGQSWCLLNSRAWAATLKIVRDSKYAESIRPCAQIHDAGYVLMRDDIDTLMFLNEHLVREVNWNNHPDIYHPTVGLGGELSIFYPTWKDEIGIPNNATEDEIINIVTKAMK